MTKQQATEDDAVAVYDSTRGVTWTFHEGFVHKLAARNPDRRVKITLSAYDAAWDPASTKRMIEGPARVTYQFWDDGGVTATVLPWEKP